MKSINNQGFIKEIFIINIWMNPSIKANLANVIREQILLKTFNIKINPSEVISTVV